MSPRARTFCRFVSAAVFFGGLTFAASSPEAIGYHLESTRPLSRFTPAQLALLSKLNHADAAHLPRLSHLIVPNRWHSDELLFSPMPQEVPELADERKALVVDIATQVFGAFENGKLVRWGPVSTGDRNHQTPSGTYHLNWHARVHVSTENPTWIMPWYFNFSSSQGIGVHQYSLPGRPASHGCVRLLAVDAKWIFNWGDGWTLGEDHEVIQPGTLVMVLGRYNFGAGQPWLRPAWWAKGVTLPMQQMSSKRGIATEE